MREPYEELRALGITPTIDSTRAWREGEQRAFAQFEMERAQMAGRIAHLEAVLHEIGLLSRRGVRR
jgi:hypothetical protein